MSIDLRNTLSGSLLENFFPAGWDLNRMDECCSNPPGAVLERQSWWHRDFHPLPCATLADFDTLLGHEIA
ncbi:MAG: glucosamine-6-phosphate isomerase, partial [Acidobacteria bacterium]|nr:glucosamine-6-phosphate isomerase [Acidobacteriota bacterium]